jgi:hypothetical protein
MLTDHLHHHGGLGVTPHRPTADASVRTVPASSPPVVRTRHRAMRTVRRRISCACGPLLGTPRADPSDGPPRGDRVALVSTQMVLHHWRTDPWREGLPEPDDGPCDGRRRCGRGGPRTPRALRRPGGLGRLIARLPRRPPAFCAAQLPADGRHGRTIAGALHGVLAAPLKRCKRRWQVPALRVPVCMMLCARWHGTLLPCPAWHTRWRWGASWHAWDAASPPPAWSGGFPWRGDHRLQRPALRAGAHPRHPMRSASCDDRWQAWRRRPPRDDGFCAEPGKATGRLPQPHGVGRTPHRPPADALCRAAPSGTTPVVRKRHRALRHVRATATLPSRLQRAPPLPTRARHPTRRARAGCKRSPLHAHAMVRQRPCRWPAVVLPGSRALAPL